MEDPWGVSSGGDGTAGRAVLSSVLPQMTPAEVFDDGEGAAADEVDGSRRLRDDRASAGTEASFALPDRTLDRRVKRISAETILLNPHLSETERTQQLHDLYHRTAAHEHDDDDDAVLARDRLPGSFIGDACAEEDWYDRGHGQERFEESMMENERMHRMMLESSYNLEVDLSSIGIDNNYESPVLDEEVEGEFIWDKCLPDQMFVCTEQALDPLLELIITNMQPKRSAAQKPVPANFIFLATRYAHYYEMYNLRDVILKKALDRILRVLQLHAQDITIHSFWISNLLLLFYYLKKDGGLSVCTVQIQQRVAELVQEAYSCLITDAERRMANVLSQSMLDSEPITELEDIHFESNWRLFRTRQKKPIHRPYSAHKPSFYRPLSPRRRALPSPRNITSLLSSVLFILEAFEVHPVIVAQVISQLFYWLGIELFNRIISNREYLARSKAMQIRLNVTALQEWLLANATEHPDFAGSQNPVFKSATQINTAYLEPIVQLLQWLQCLSSLSDDVSTLEDTLSCLDRLSLAQLLHTADAYRYEVGEQRLSQTLKKALVDRHCTATGQTSNPCTMDESLWLLGDSRQLLPFTLPTHTELVVSYGAGIGGTHRERERRHRPTLPPDFLERVDAVLESRGRVDRTESTVQI